MEKISQMISEKTGISESQAQTAVTMVLSFLKDKMPEGMGSQVESYLKGDGEGGNDLSGLAEKIGGMFGK